MHLTRLNAPKSWLVKRKTTRYIVRPTPGPHSLKSSIPLAIILGLLLNYADTKREIKLVLNKQEIYVNGIRRKCHAFGVGLFDTIDIPTINEHYIVLLNKGGYFTLIQNNRKFNLYKVLGKNILKKGTLQLNLTKGKNLLIDKKDPLFKIKFSLGDSLLFKDKDIEHLKLEKGAYVFLAQGKHIGNIGILESTQMEELEKDKITFSIGNKKFETLKDYAFVIDKELYELLSEKKETKTAGSKRKND